MGHVHGSEGCRTRPTESGGSRGSWGRRSSGRRGSGKAVTESPAWTVLVKDERPGAPSRPALPVRAAIFHSRDQGGSR
ncbi:unnamed protein product [[Actinomadura] parvosata subsp. kistnae]|nr:unnamed protein product [Actinomadura parvosata subsp. kistnae]